MAEKVIVITGASAGIGAALAKILGAQGHALVLAARRDGELRQIADATGARAVTVVADVALRADVTRIRDEALAAFGHVDVWVNNAGRGIVRSALDLTDEDIDEMIDVNLKSALYGMQAIVPHFRERGGGHLINVSSFLGRVPFVPFRSAYSAAKAALNILTSNVRMELHATHPGIHVSLVMPGPVTTEFALNARGGPPAGTPPPGGAFRPQSAEEVAQAIAGVIEKPVPELYTTPMLADLARRYYEDVGAFEEGHRQTRPAS